MLGEQLPQIIAAMAVFGIFVILPVVTMFLRHQRMMAELIHGKSSDETVRRLESVEHELRELKAAHYERVLREDDQQRLTQRITPGS